MNSIPDELPQLANYRALELIHTSDRTLVYRGRNEENGESVVIKLMGNEYPSFNELVRFRNQYAIVKNLEIEGIIKPYALVRYENRYALIMEDAEGISLAENTEFLSLPQLLNLAIQLATILHQLHQNRIIHKDIKPANILIHPDTRRVKLIDFSVSSLLPKENQSIQTPNLLEGTLAYLSPEQTGRMNRGIDYRSDFYSLGVTFYQLLTGRLPFESDDAMELIHCHIAQHPRPPRAVLDEQGIHHPPIISDIILKLMAKNAEERYQSALGLKYDLEQCLMQYQETGTIASFELGERDRCDRFLIQEKLYGREIEVQTLLDAFERVASGKTEMMLVAGFSGIGKTAVVNEVHKPIVRQRGYFIKGKFDQFNRNIPFSALVQAFRDLMGQLLGESDLELANWKAKILAAVGENGQVLIEVIPELERIIGEQPSVPKLEGNAAQNRFNLLFERFIAVFTTQEHPLTLFLDDLQWADSASFNLLKVLMGDTQPGYLLLLGAYRDNEVFPTHPLMLSLAELEKQNTTISTITLAPLSIAHVNQLVAQTLSCPAELATTLTDLVYQKTRGNPFFSAQFLKGLHEDGAIAFNYDLGYWECDLVKVRSAALTDDVVEFMAAQLQKLPEETQKVLKLAACIGNQFDLETLAIICKTPLEEVSAALWSALGEGLILPQSEAYKFFQEWEAEESREESIAVGYCFLHDRVQQAAYSLIGESQKQITHYQIGKLLRENLDDSAQNKMIFDVVNHLNFGQDLLSNKGEREQLANLNLSAGQKAMSSTAYEAAIEYFETGIALLGEGAWQDQYNSIFLLYKNLGMAQLSYGDYMQLNSTVEVVVQEVVSPVDRAAIFVLQIVSYSLQGQYLEAIQGGLKGLENLGVTIERDNLAMLVEQEFAAVAAALGDRDVYSLLDRPTEVPPTIRAEIQLALSLDPPTYIVGDFDLYSFVSLRAVRQSVEQGNLPESAKGYANYSLLLGLIQGQYQRGYQFADMAVQLADKLGSKAYQCQAGLILGAWIHVWAKPIAGAARVNYDSFIVGMEVGEVQFAAYNLFGYIYNLLFQGEDLNKIVAEIQTYFAIAAKDDLSRMAFAGAQLFTQQSIAPQLSLDDNTHESIATARAIIHAGEETQSMGMSLYTALALHRACIMGTFEEGVVHFNTLTPLLSSLLGFTTYSYYFYYGSLALLNAALTDTPEQDVAYWQQIAANQDQLKIWANSCPENFLHKYQLVEAESSRCRGEQLLAMELYDQAITGAKENGFIQEEALANELAAKFYLEWGKAQIATIYIQKAYYCYAQWGAKAKTNDLEKRYSRLLKPIFKRDRLTLSSQVSISKITSNSQTQTTTIPNISSILDFSALLKASQTVSGEIELEKLLSTLMKIILENAGATKGALLLIVETELTVEAIATRNDEENTLQLDSVHQSIPLENYADLPSGLINYVRRTTETALLDAQTAQTQFAADNYLVRCSPQSLLCLPLLERGKLIGILYLENNLTADAFTSDRIDLLDALCAQAAISLTNARLYQQARQALTDLQHAQLQLVQNEKMATLGNLVAGVAHEINNPVGFIGGNLNAAREHLEDLLTGLALYEEYSGQPLPEDIIEEIDELELDFVAEDFPKLIASMQSGCDRIRNISTSLRTFSRTDTDAKTELNLQEGLDSTLLILKYRLKANEQRPAIKIEKNYGEIPAINCYPGQINQVFMNLLANAIDALDESNEGKTYAEIEQAPNRIIISTELREEKTSLIVKIADNGTGIPEELKERIFEQGFTTKEVGKGTGLGMAIAKSIIEEKHGGAIATQSELGKGTEFIISLPIS